MPFWGVELCSLGGGDVPFWGVEMCQSWGVEMCLDEVNYSLPNIRNFSEKTSVLAGSSVPN
jgi:hypothetical protein